MRRILSSIAALAFILSVSIGTGVAKDNPKSHGKGKGDGVGAPSMALKCAPGQNPVTGYKTKSGKWIKPYCRKAKHSM
jgi:hypothetical protein